MELTGKRVLVTGAASGIGRATALLAARQGAELYLTDLDPDGLAATAEAVVAAGGAVGHHGALDVSDLTQVQALADEVHARVGSVDVVMNIAGVSTWGTVDRLTHRHWRKLVEVNLMGPIHVIETFVPPMIRAGRGGHLVNVSSAAGLFGLPWHAAYSASKFGLRGVSEVLRFDLREHRIGVSLVCPGAVRTPLTETVEIVGVDRDGPELRRALERFRRHAVTPEAAARAIVKGIRKNRYLVYTSADIRLVHLAQRLCPPLYVAAMRALGVAMRRALPVVS
ncbi:SDR family oxidoreductase [Pseudonocardia acaciae]|uniref:SDR family oxidoreductase n=1 Tax=Pseudonocardia acaciae TaxID=551276 RepID=UPI00048ECDAB|nr:SDR family oxidoreductase [Pseudonocardia acaciae]